MNHWWLMRGLRLCRCLQVFQSFPWLKLQACVCQKKNFGGGDSTKKITSECFCCFFWPYVNCVYKCIWRENKKTFVIGVLLTSFSSSQSFNAPWIEGTFDCVYFYFLEATRISRPPGRRSKLSTQTILKLGSKVAADSSLPPRSILNSRLSSDTLRWRNLLDLTGLKLSLEKLLSSPCFNSAPS